MKSRWRKQYYDREWTFRVDRSIIYQLEAEAAQLKRLADELMDERIKQIYDRLVYLLAAAAGKTVDFNLSEHVLKRKPSDGEQS